MASAEKLSQPAMLQIVTLRLLQHLISDLQQIKLKKSLFLIRSMILETTYHHQEVLFEPLMRNEKSIDGLQVIMKNINIQKLFQ
jgi:hypothetical protein